MPKIEQKQVVIDEIKEKLSKALSIVLIDARGLTVEQDTILRKQLREAGVDYKVYKNSMINFAIKDTQFEGCKEFLKGPSAIAFSYEDSTLAARIINKNTKAMPELEFKAAIIEGSVYDGTMVKEIAEIPSREELISKLLGSFKSPVASFARVINAIAEKQGESESA